MIQFNVPVIHNIFVKRGFAKQSGKRSECHLLMIYRNFDFVQYNPSYSLGGITNIGENDWPPLDNYIAPYREPILSPTTSNSLHPYADIGNAKENGIITILPPPKKFRQDENQPKKIVNQRLPRNFFLPSLQYATNTSNANQKGKSYYGKGPKRNYRSFLQQINHIVPSRLLIGYTQFRM